MKVVLVVLSLGFALVGCEQKKVAAEGIVAATPSPLQQPGGWMWDKGRGNPLEQPAKRHPAVR